MGGIFSLKHKTLAQRAAKHTTSLTDKSLSNISFTGNNIGKTIKCLDPSKAHCHDMMSIRMLCGDSIYKPLHLIFRASLDQGTFPLRWKKSQRCACL